MADATGAGRVFGSGGVVVMVDDNDADLRVAKICYGRSVLENEWRAFAQPRAFLSWIEHLLASGAAIPALLLLDINMGELSGYDVLTWVRDRAALAELPVVMMLTNTDSELDRTRSLALGANGLCSKPFRIADYVAFFDGLLRDASLGVGAFDGGLPDGGADR